MKYQLGIIFTVLFFFNGFSQKKLAELKKQLEGKQKEIADFADFWTDQLHLLSLF
jgi:hypothetical protein